MFNLILFILTFAAYSLWLTVFSIKWGYKRGRDEGYSEGFTDGITDEHNKKECEIVKSFVEPPE